MHVCVHVVKNASRLFVLLTRAQIDMYEIQLNTKVEAVYSDVLGTVYMYRVLLHAYTTHNLEHIHVVLQCTFGTKSYTSWCFLCSIEYCSPIVRYCIQWQP